MAIQNDFTYIRFPLRITINGDEDARMKFTEDFFQSKTEQLASRKQYDTFESAIEVEAKYPFLVFKIMKQDHTGSIRVRDIEGLYCLTPLGKYQFVKNPLA